MRLLVLGSMLRRGSAHGYDVFRDLADWHADTWTSVKPGSIYHAIEKLAAQQLLLALPALPNDAPKPGPAKTVYQVTEEGKAAFLELVEAALRSNEIQQFAAGIAFMEWLTRRQVQRILAEREAAQQQSVRFLEGLPTKAEPAKPSEHPELVGLWAGYMAFQMGATQRMLAAIEAGQYRFAGESVPGQSG